MALTTGNAFVSDKADKRIAELEAERDKLRAELEELKAWRSRIMDAVGGDEGFCCCGLCSCD